MEETKKKRERVDWIDSAKGIAILLVVVGHVGGGYTGNYSVPEYQELIDYVVWLIYTFHMPLFFCLSGYVYRLSNAKVSNHTEYKGLVIKKAKKLMIPYYICSTVQILIKLPFQGKISSVLSWKDILLLPIHPVDQYWFIYTLFICYVLMAFLEWKIVNKKIILCIAFGMWLIMVPITSYAPSTVLWYFYTLARIGESFVFFYLGTMLYDIKYKAVVFQAIPCALIFLVLQGMVYFSGIDFGIGLSFVRFCLAEAAIIAVIYISNIKIVKCAKWLGYVGKNSMSIYIVHVVLCAAIRIILYRVGITNFAVHIISGTVLSVVIPLMLQNIWDRLRLKISRKDD